MAMTRDRAAAAPAGAAETSFSWGQILTIAGAHFVHDSFSSFLNPLLPLIIDKLSLSLTLAGSLAFFNRLPSLLNPFIGMWADRIDLRLLVVLAPTVTAVAMSLLGLAPNYAMLLLLLLAMGLSSAALHVPGPVIISRTAGKRVGTGMSIWMVGGELARMVGPLAAVSLVTWLTLEGYYPAMILGMLTSVVLYLRFKKIPLQGQAQARPAPLGEAWKAVSRLMLPMAAIMGVSTAMRAALSTFLPTFMYLNTSDQSLWSGGTALAVVEFSGALGALAAGTLSDKIGRRRVIFVALLGAPLLLLLFLSLEGQGRSWLSYPVLALVGFTSLSTTPVMMAMVQEHGRRHPATANGIYMAISFVIGSAGPLLVGLAGDVAGLESAFYWSAVVALAGAPMAFLLPARSSRAGT